MYEKFQTMSKEEYCEKYSVGIRFLFGYIDNLDCEISIRAIISEKYFQKSIDNLNLKNIIDTMDLFKKTPFFDTLTEQVIEVDFEKEELILPDFFIKHDIEIIPYFTKGIENNQEITKKEFFKLLKQNNAKKLKYLCFLFFNNHFCEEEYECFSNLGKLKL